MRALFILISLLFLFESCRTKESLFKREQYQTLVNRSLKAGLKGRLKSHEIGYFIDGFNAWHYQEEARLKKLYQSNFHKDWMLALKRIHEIEALQTKVQYFPQINTSELLFINIEHWKIRFNDQLYAYHNQRYERFLKEYAQTDNRQFVKDAYFEIDKINTFLTHPNPEDIAARRAHCLTLGHRYIFLDYKRGTFVSESDFSFFLKRAYPASDEWNTFLDDTIQSKIDYHIAIHLEYLDSDYTTTSSSEGYSKEVITGHETKKDTSGNTIRIPIYETVYASVETVYYEYEAEGRVECVLANERNTAMEDQYSSFNRRIDDDCEAVSTSGDSRALPSAVFCSSCSVFLDCGNLEQDVLRDLARQITHFLEEI